MEPCGGSIGGGWVGEQEVWVVGGSLTRQALINSGAVRRFSPKP